MRLPKNPTPSQQIVLNVRTQFSRSGVRLIHRFFVSFSRFECALKTSGTFAKQIRSNIEPDWDKFCRTIDKDCNYTKPRKLKKAVEYILSAPPKVQQEESGAIVWRDRPVPSGITKTEQIGLLIRRIRNNLFHGGKFNGEMERDVSRNFLLLNSGLIILDEWLNVHADVRHLFLEAIA